MRYVNHSRKNPNMRPVSVNTGDTTQRVFFITVKNAPLGQVSIAHVSPVDDG